MRRAVTLCIGLLLLPSALQAQVLNTGITGPPMLPNYERVPVGEREALEAGAYIARTSDPNANWYNPAGLALVERTGANLSANAYEATTIEVASLRRETSNLRLAPLGAFFGLAVAEPLTSSNKVRYGFFIARPIAWQSGTLDEEVAIDAQNTLAAQSEASLTRMEPGLAIGWRVNDRFRLGASVGVSITSLDMIQDISVRYSSPDSSSTTRRTLTIDGSTWHLVPRFGMQWDVAGKWHVGVVAAAPGVKMSGSAGTTFSAGTFASENRYRTITFRDEEADFDYKLPFSGGVGVAWNYSRGSVEGAVRYYASLDEYDMITSTHTAQQIDAIGGNPPAVSTLPVAGIPNQWNDVTNIAIGGNYAFSDALSLHLGFNSDSSPVADPSRTIFRKVNLFGGTAGISYQGTTFGASVGLGFSRGESDPIDQLVELGAPPVETTLKVNTFRAMYSFSARF